MEENKKDISLLPYVTSVQFSLHCFLEITKQTEKKPNLRNSTDLVKQGITIAVSNLFLIDTNQLERATA